LVFEPLLEATKSRFEREVPYCTFEVVGASVLHFITIVFSVGDCKYGPRITL
jgi:hypothetical protein